MALRTALHTGKVAGILAIVAGLLCLLGIVGLVAMPATRPSSPACRIARVMAYNAEYGLAAVVFGPFLPDTLTTLAALPLPPYPAGLFCTTAALPDH